MATVSNMRKSQEEPIEICNACKVNHESELKSDCATGKRVKQVAMLVPYREGQRGDQCGVFTGVGCQPARFQMVCLLGRQLLAGGVLERSSLCSLFLEES